MTDKVSSDSVYLLRLLTLSDSTCTLLHPSIATFSNAEYQTGQDPETKVLDKFFDGFWPVIKTGACGQNPGAGVR